MILFVFEGDKREPRLFDAIKEIFLPKELSSIVCTYKCNIYHLYTWIKKYDFFGDSTSVDTVSILNEILLRRGDTTLQDIPSSEISEIYLFFDYDFHHHDLENLDEDNAHIGELLDFFHDETENGKLYINYPMIESIRYTKELPDLAYVSYVISRNSCKTRNFKSFAHEFSAYCSLDHLLLSDNPQESTAKKQQRLGLAKQNWLHLIKMNVSKANYIYNKKCDWPNSKSQIAQSTIFEAQLREYVCRDECQVAILNSLPIFLYDYLKNLPE